MSIQTSGTLAAQEIPGDPYTASTEPEDGAIILRTATGGWQDINSERVFVRTDREPGQTDGDWWAIGDSADRTDVKAWTWLEILAFDEPTCDRPTITWQRLYTADEMHAMAGAR